MRLGAVLLKRKMPNGNIWKGKHRFGHNIYADNIERMYKNLKLEEKNLFYLRHPYLSEEQEYKCTQPLKKQGKWINTFRVMNVAQRLKPSLKLEDKLGHLLKNSPWEK